MFDDVRRFYLILKEQQSTAENKKQTSVLFYLFETFHVWFPACFRRRGRNRARSEAKADGFSICLQTKHPAAEVDANYL